MGDRVDDLGMVHSCEQAPPEKRETLTTTEIEHEGCPYVAVIVKDGYWICTKCGQGGRLDG